MPHQEIGRPLLLSGDTFTPPARTPWGGHRIRALKRLPPGPIVGEAWELSVEPSFVSRAADGRPLTACFADAPEVWLGEEAKRGSTALLVKLLDAHQPLSVQIHPHDDDPALGPAESGKPEAWYIVDAEPGAELALGLAPGTDRAAVERALDGRADLRASLRFVSVAPGDVFVIEPGLPHSIGAGILLVEPQRVVPGRRGVTYRYWDFDRRYDADGQPDPNGAPRELHRERALAVTDWDRASAPALIDHVRHRAGAADRRGPAHAERVLESTLYIERLAGVGALTLDDRPCVRSITVLDGEVTIDGLRLTRGATAALPAGLRSARVELEAAHAIVCGLGG
ncbi:MAG: class I mannose-6-phosphate isomerase [Sandaracinaceae bacterium]